MTGYQSTDDFNGLLEGRTLRFMLTGSESKSGRPLSAAFEDVASGEIISVMTISGALQAGVVPIPDEFDQPRRPR